MSDFLKKYRKIILALLFSLGAIFGLIQRSHDPYFGSTRSRYFAPAEKSLADYYKEAEDRAKILQAPSVTFTAVGDISLSRGVAAAVKTANDPSLPFQGMADVFKQADFNFGNLESPFSPSPKTDIIGGHTLIFGAPQNYIRGLVQAKFQAVSLANNHALDLGLAGLSFTRDWLLKNGIQGAGAGQNQSQAWQPAVVSAKGLKFCFIAASYASVNDGGKTKNTYLARIEDLDNLKNAVMNARQQCNLVIASMHAGTEYTAKPNQAQIAFARAAINAGADLVIGHHPHWIQTIEKYNGSPPHPNCKKSSFENPFIEQENIKIQALDLGNGCGGKYIFYSLGNFIFDQNWSQKTKEGLALKITASGSQTPNALAPGAAGLTDLQGPRPAAKIESIELVPVIIENSQPRPAAPDETKKILDRIGKKDNRLE